MIRFSWTFYGGRSSLLEFASQSEKYKFRPLALIHFRSSHKIDSNFYPIWSNDDSISAQGYYPYPIYSFFIKA